MPVPVLVAVCSTRIVSVADGEIVSPGVNTGVGLALTDGVWVRSTTSVIDEVGDGKGVRDIVGVKLSAEVPVIMDVAAPEGLKEGAGSTDGVGEIVHTAVADPVGVRLAVPEGDI